MKKIVGDLIDDENSSEHFCFERSLEKDGIEYKGWFFGYIHNKIREPLPHLDNVQYEVVKTDDNVLKELEMCILENIGVSGFDSWRHETRLIKENEDVLYLQLDDELVPFSLDYRLMANNIRDVWSI